MSKFIFTLFRFLIFSLIIYIPLVILWVEWDYNSFIKYNVWYELNEAGIDSTGNVNSYGHMFTRMREVKNTHDVDLLFCGASQAYRGFDTRIFREAGYKTFNLGSSNQTPLQTEVLLKRYVDRLNPKIAIYVVYPEVFEADGVESTLDIIANDKVDFYLFYLTLKQKNFKLLNTLIYASYRQVFGLDKNFKELKQKQNDSYVSGGYVEKDLTHYGYFNYETSCWHFNDKQFKVFYRTIDSLKDRGIKVYLIQAPTPKAFDQSHSNNSSFDSLMNAVGNYYNFNQMITLDDSLHFYDKYHLNQLGVEVFNKKVIEILDIEKLIQN